MSTHILQAADLLQAGPEAPFALLPEPPLFLRRAERFRTLAGGAGNGGTRHPQAEWLHFMGELTVAQHAALPTVQACELPAPGALEQARQHLMPPLSINSLERDPAWQQALRDILEHLQKNWPNATFATRATCERLTKAPAGALETLADKVLGHDLGDQADLAASVFVAAALQVYWTALAARLAPGSLVRLDNKGLCPCCGSLPVVSVVHAGGAVGNLRYLHCSLCNSEWNLVRVTCASCDNTAGIAYHSLQGQHPAVRAETCDACMGYLKILYQEKDPQADPVADDLATLALDVLIDEAGYERAGPNLFVLAGA